LEYVHDNVWHPHIHLDYRGERDFDHYEIWKWKTGWDGPVKWATCNDTGWTDTSECVDASGQDSPWWNCYYFAKSVDYQNNNTSDPSQLALFRVGCEQPICYGCYGDRPVMNTNRQNSTTSLRFTSSNYPNPFNPSTMIRFVLPKAYFVRITVYNCIGQLIKELTSRWYDAGINDIEFDGTNFPSGIYFYKIEAIQSSSFTIDFVQSKKMVLIK
jgi:hypothetical protein